LSKDKEIHPLKRKSIKPSSSTVRGMLPGPQFRALDAAMQSLRSAGLRLDWNWKSKSVGWVCSGLLDELVVCELRPTEEPLVGVIELPHAMHAKAVAEMGVSKRFKAVLASPVEETAKFYVFEIPLEETRFRDLFSELIEELLPFMTK